MAHRAPLDRPPQERALAWLYTGPLGQLWGAVADVAEMWTRWQLWKLRQRRGGSQVAGRGSRE